MPTRDEFNQRRQSGKDAEDLFQQWVGEAGWHTSKKGWPDFMVWNDDGDVMVVEVKVNDYTPLSAAQHHVMKILEEHGIPVYKWSPTDGKLRPRMYYPLPAKKKPMSRPPAIPPYRKRLMANIEAEQQRLRQQSA